MVVWINNVNRYNWYRIEWGFLCTQVLVNLASSWRVCVLVVFVIVNCVFVCRLQQQCYYYHLSCNRLQLVNILPSNSHQYEQRTLITILYDAMRSNDIGFLSLHTNSSEVHCHSKAQSSYLTYELWHVQRVCHLRGNLLI